MRDSISDLINKISEYLDENLINQHVCCNRKKPNLPTSHISTTQPKRHLTNPKRRRIKQGLSPTHFFVNPNHHHSCTTVGGSYSTPLPKNAKAPKEESRKKRKKKKGNTWNKGKKRQDEVQKQDK